MNELQKQIVDIITAYIGKSTERLTFNKIKADTGLRQLDMRLLEVEHLDALKDLVRVHNLRLRLSKLI